MTSREEQLIRCGEELVRAIQNACWTNMRKKPNLTGPTPHMQLAINEFKAVAYPTCDSCGQELPRRG